MIKKNGFTLVELLIVIAIIGILASIGIVSFTSSQMKSRDIKRKTNLSQIAQALELYNNDKGRYPTGSSGNINGCGAGATSACTWGESAFSNTTTGTIYMVKLPDDPSTFAYYYVSIGSGTGYKLYAHLENSKDQSILSTITYTTQCGGTGGTCNYGISSANTTP